MLENKSHDDDVAEPLKSFCKTVNIGETKARAEIKSGRLSAKRIGKKILITRLARREWLNNLPSAA